MRKLYSGQSRVDSSVLLQAWIAPGNRSRSISLSAFRADAEVGSETVHLPWDDTRGLAEIVPSLLDAFERRLAPKLSRLH